MSWWHVGLVANAVISVAYFSIVWSIVRPLVRSHQLRSNPLGAATAAIFFTCAVHHGAHSVHMVLPELGVDLTRGLAMRTAWGWELALWDVVGAVVGVYYLTLRHTYSSLMQGAQLFQDFRAREQQALELNDNVLQGLVVARMALEVDDRDRALASLDTAIGSASGMITDLLASTTERGSAGLLRSSAALTEGPPAPARRVGPGRDEGADPGGRKERPPGEGHP